MNTDDILMKGWLLKSPPDHRSWFTFSKSLSRKTNPRWRSRYFCLFAVDAINNLPSTKAGLNYYKGEIESVSNTSERCVGSIDLTHCDEVFTELTGDKAELQFAIRTKHKGRDRTYKLQAETVAEMQRWVDCLCTVLGLKEKYDTNLVAPDLQSASSEGYIHIEECYSGKDNNNGGNGDSNHQMNCSLPLPQHSPRSRRSSVPTRPVPSPNLSPSLRPSQIDLSQRSPLEAIPPCPLDSIVMAPKELAPPRPQTEYDVLPPPVSTTPSPATKPANYNRQKSRPPLSTINRSATSKASSSTYDVLPRVVIPSTYDTLPKPSTATYDTLPKPSPSPSSASITYDSPSVNHLSTYDKLPRSAGSVGSRGQYDVLPTSRSSDYDIPPSPVKNPSFIANHTPNIANHAPSYIAPSPGKKPFSPEERRQPMMMNQRSVPNTPAPPIPTSAAAAADTMAYINLDQRSISTPGSTTTVDGYIRLTGKTPASPPPGGYVAPSPRAPEPRAPSDLPPSERPPPPPGSVITQDDTYDFPARRSMAVDTFADENLPPAPCLKIHKYINSPSGYMPENGPKMIPEDKTPLSMDIPIGRAPLPPTETAPPLMKNSIYNTPPAAPQQKQQHYHVIPKAVADVKAPMRNKSFKRILPPGLEVSKPVKTISKKYPSSDESSESELAEVINNSTVQYLDLDHENTSEGISPVPSIQASTTDYNEIDFEKTQILTNMRRERQNDN